VAARSQKLAAHWGERALPIGFYDALYVDCNINDGAGAEGIVPIAEFYRTAA
jgi:hypothetical protein